MAGFVCTALENAALPHLHAPSTAGQKPGLRLAETLECTRAFTAASGRALEASLITGRVEAQYRIVGHSMQKHRGSCHCGNVQFEIESDVTRIVTCNCSFCIRRGAMLHGVPPDKFRILRGAPGEPDGASRAGRETEWCGEDVA